MPRASRTGSLMPQSLRRRGAGGAPRRIDGRERAQREGHAAHLEHVDGLDVRGQIAHVVHARVEELRAEQTLDRKSTRLNSSHVSISYAGFCLKKKTETRRGPQTTSLPPA